MFDVEDVAEKVRTAAEVAVRWEAVEGRYVRCGRSEWDDQCPPGPRGLHYALSEGGGHAHYQPYDKPYRRLVIRLPAEPGSEYGPV